MIPHGALLAFIPSTQVTEALLFEGKRAEEHHIPLTALRAATRAADGGLSRDKDIGHIDAPGFDLLVGGGALVFVLSLPPLLLLLPLPHPSPFCGAVVVEALDETGLGEQQKIEEVDGTIHKVKEGLFLIGFYFFLEGTYCLHREYGHVNNEWAGCT